MLHRLVFAVPVLGWLACSLGFDGDNLQTGASSSSVAAASGSGEGGAGGDDGCTCLDVPDGWDPVVLLHGVDAACGPGEEVIAEGGIGFASAAPAQCDDCTCGTPDGACKVNLFLYSDQACNEYLIDFPGPACNNEPFGGGYASITAGGTVNSMASCAPGGGQATLPPVQWMEPVLACSVTGDQACGPGQVCARSSTALERVCIFQGGEPVVCPPEFSEAVLVSKVESDTRACSACSCGPASGAECQTGSVTYYGQNNCGGTVLATTSLGACYLPPFPSLVESAEITPTVPGSCVPLGGTAIGEVTYSDGTYCCFPAS